MWFLSETKQQKNHFFSSHLRNIQLYFVDDDDDDYSVKKSSTFNSIQFKIGNIESILWLIIFVLKSNNSIGTKKKNVKEKIHTEI